MNEKTVLIVEDDIFLSSLLKNRLEKEGLVAVVAKNGEEALRILNTLSPALILLDIILPGKSGFEIMESMKSNANLNKIPIMIISNLGQESDIERGRKLGAVEYFVKARTSINDLIKKVNVFLQEHLSTSNLS